MADFKIDIEVNARDNTGGALQSASGKMTAFERSVEKTNAQLQKLSGRNANININAQDRASAVIDRVIGKLKGSKAGQFVLSAVDRASSVIDNVLAKLKGSRAGQFVLSALDRAGPVISKVGTQLRSLAGKAWNIAVNVAGNAKDTIARLGSGLGKLTRGATMALGLGGTFAVGSAVKNGMSFDAGMSTVRAVSGASNDEMQQLTDFALSEAKRTKFTTTETADALKYMGMAGWKTEQMMNGLPAILNLAAAGGADLATTSDIVTDAMTAFKMPASEAGRFADVLAVASSSANTNVEMMGETFKYAGSLAGTMGYSIEDMALATGLMANASIKGSQAGTALRTGMVNLAKPTKEMKEVMDKYGLSLTDNAGNMKSFKEILQDVRHGFKGVANEADEAGDLAKLFGKYGLAGWAAIVNATDEEFNSLAESIGKSSGAAQKMSDIMMDNLQGDIDKLKSAWDVGIYQSMFSNANPFLRKGVQALTEVVNKIPAFAENAASIIVPKFELLKDILSPESFFKEHSLRKAGLWDDWMKAGKPDTLGGKLQFAWDELVAEPLGDWWSETGHAKAAEFAAGFGKGAGTLLSGGLAALFGLTGSDVTSEGLSIGGSFVEGFKQGFEEFDVGAAIASAFKNHPIASGLLSNWLIQEVTGLNIPELLLGKLFGKLFGGGAGAEAGAGGAYACEVMEVSAGVVNVNGGQVNNGSQQPGSNPGKQNTGAQTPASVPKLSAGSPQAQTPGGAVPALGAGGAAGAGAAGAKMLGAGTGAAGGTLPAWAGNGVYDSAGTLLWTTSDFAPGVSPVFAGGAIGGMALAAGYMLWNESGLNPKNYTIGQKRDKGYFDVKPAEMTSGSDAVTKYKPGDPKATRDMPPMRTGYAAGMVGAKIKKESTWLADRTVNGSKLDNAFSSFLNWLKPTAKAADLDESPLAPSGTSPASRGSLKSSGGKGSKKPEDFYPDFLEQSGKNKIPLDADMFDTEGLGSGLMSKIGDSVSEADMGNLSIGESLMSMIGESLDGVDLENINIGEQLMSAIGESMDALDFENVSIGEQLMSAISTSLESVDLENVSIGEQIMNAVSASMESVDLENINIGEQIMSGISASLEAVDFTGVITPIMTQLEELNAIECRPAIEAMDEASDVIANVQTAIDTLAGTACSPTITATDNASSTISSIESKLASLNGKTATVTVNIQTNGSWPAGVKMARGTRSAPGGWATINDQKGSHYTELVDQGGSLMEYSGRDVSVPLRRGAKVYTADQRRRMLAALDGPHYAEGIGNEENAGWITDTGAGGTEGTENGLNITVSMQPTIEINGGADSATAIAAAIKTQFRDMADDVANEIALNLTKIFPNMPARGVAY